MLKKIIALLLTTSILFPSCEKEATVKPPKADPKLVVYCFISPSDTLISVSVKQSKPIFSSSAINPNAPISNASVTFSDGTNSCSLTYNPLKQNYTAPASLVPLLAGKTYYLNVSSPDGKSISAETIIPASMPGDFNINFVSSDSSVSCHWTDISNEINYYRLALYRINCYAGSTDTSLQLIAFSEPETDHNRDGNYFEEHYPFNITIMPGTTYRAARAILFCCNKDYYLYHTTLTNAYNGGNPFAEPVLVYSNIKNGLGVFAAYLSTVKEKTY